jgi:hypothetical protein
LLATSIFLPSKHPVRRGAATRWSSSDSFMSQPCETRSATPDRQGSPDGSPAR